MVRSGADALDEGQQVGVEVVSLESASHGHSATKADVDLGLSDYSARDTADIHMALQAAAGNNHQPLL